MARLETPAQSTEWTVGILHSCKSRKSWIFLDKCESSSGKDQVDAILLKGYFSKFVLKVIKIGSQQMIGTGAEISWRYRSKHRILVSFIKTVPASEMPIFFFFFFKPLTSCFCGDLEPSQDNPNDIIRGWSNLPPEPLKTLHNCLYRTAHYKRTLDDMFYF